MQNGFLDNFALPDVAVQALSRAGLKESELGDGVSRLISGHDKGMGFRFFIHTDYNPVKSKAAHYEVYDEIEMIEWFSDRYSKPVERVRLLPAELLSVDAYTGEVSGRYAEAYTRFKKGLSAPGTPLSKWGVLSDGEIATLAANGVFSVEQFAAMPREKVTGKFPPEFHDFFERAIQFCNSKQNRMEADKQASEIIALQKERDKQATELAELRAQIEALAADKKGCSGGKKRGRPSKETDDDSVLSEG